MYQEKCQISVFRFRDNMHLNTQAINYEILENSPLDKFGHTYLDNLAEDYYLNYNREMITIQIKFMREDCFDLADQKIAVEVP